jgi:3'-5' exoribonuclease
MRMVAEKMAGLPDFPPRLRSLVEHMILSHHGHLEFGSPKLPQFPEALLLHYLDDLDSKMECMRALIENDRQVDGCFTTYNTALERPALKKERYLNPPVEPPRTRPTAEPNGTPAASPPAPVASPQLAAHPLFAARPESFFADKLKQALHPAEPKQES